MFSSSYEQRQVIVLYEGKHCSESLRQLRENEMTQIETLASHLREELRPGFISFVLGNDSPDIVAILKGSGPEADEMDALTNEALRILLKSADAMTNVVALAVGRGLRILMRDQSKI